MRASASSSALVLLLAACSSPSAPIDAARSDGGAPRDSGPLPDGDVRPDGGTAPSFLRCPPVTPSADGLAELPRERVDTTMPVLTGRTVHVASGGDLQAALDDAQGGDIIELEAGATFTGPFTIGDRTGTDWVIVRSDGAALPPEGARALPSDAPAMARLVAPAGLPALVAASSAHHVRFIGIELTTAGDVYTTALVDLGSSVTVVAELPHHLVFDRCYLHGSATLGTRRGIALNSAHTAIIESYFTDFREMGADSQAICGWSGPGPFGIYDNFLAGAAENVMFGGASSHGPGTNPADIEICGNHFSKPLTWFELDPSYAGLDWVNKNIFELKNARRVLFAGNVLEHSWGDGQVGFAILLTPRAEGDVSLEHAVTDVTITLNLVRDAASGIAISSVDDGTPGSLVTERLVIENNVFVGLDGERWNGAGRTYQIVNGGATGHDLLFAHNTSFQVGNAAIVLGDTAPVFDGFIVRDNILEHATYGLFGSGAGEGTGGLDTFVPGYVYSHNLMFGDATVAARYPAENFFEADAASVGFVDLAAGDLALSGTSAYLTQSTTGGALGADAETVARLAALAAP
jgi:hypothetical protein